MQELVRELNSTAAQHRARRTADACRARRPACRDSWPARSGPTSRTASLSPDVNDPGLRNITFDELVATYGECDARARSRVERI